MTTIANKHKCYLNTEQCCDSCHYYWRPTAENGYCLWADMRKLPSCMVHQDFMMPPEGGNKCPVWLAK